MIITKVIIKILIIKKSYGLYNVVSVREKFWVSLWFVSHAKNVIRGAYYDGGHFNCYIVEVGFSMPSSLHMSKNDSDA